MAHQLIILPLDSNLEKSLSLVARNPGGECAGRNRLLIDPVGSLFIHAIAIACADDSRPAGEQLFLQMVGRKDAVAIGKEKIRCAAISYAIVATKRDTKSVVRMTGPVERKACVASKFADQ